MTGDHCGANPVHARGLACCQTSRHRASAKWVPFKAQMLLAATAWLLVSCTSADPSAQIVLLGDVMLGRGVAQAHSAEGWEEALDALRPLTSVADLTAANLESPLTAEPRAGEVGYDLRAPPEAVRALDSAGVSLVALANNHVLDAGQAGLRETLETLRASGIDAVGPTASPLLRSKEGLRIAFVAFDDVSQHLDSEMAARSVREARTISEVVIVSIHWGSEYLSVPNPRQRELAQALAGAGASLIWGHHPHVVQPVEWVEGGALPHGTLVAYSLGNTLFDQAGPPDTRRSVALWVTVGEGGVRAVRVFGFSIEPGSLSLRTSNADDRLALEQRLGPIAGRGR